MECGGRSAEKRAAVMSIFDVEKKTSLRWSAVVQAWPKGGSFLGLQGMPNCIYESDWWCSLVIHLLRTTPRFEIDIH